MFREEDEKYKALRLELIQTFNRADHPGKGILIEEVDNLMLASYRLMQHIKHYVFWQNMDSELVATVPLLTEAVRDARRVIEGKDGITALYYEVERLEALSRAAYRWLKVNDRLPVVVAAQEQIVVQVPNYASISMMHPYDLD